MFGTPPIVAEPLAPLLAWIHVLMGCTLLLGLETLILFLVGWRQQWSRWARLSALVPLMGSVGVGLAVHHLSDLYLMWAQNFYSLASPVGHVSFPLPYSLLIRHYVTSLTQEANSLGWTMVAVTALLLLGGLVGLAFATKRRKRRMHYLA